MALHYEKNPIVCFCHNDYMAQHYAFMMNVVIILNLKSFPRVSCYPLWVNEMDEEIKIVYENKTWNFLPSLPHRKFIGCQWIYKVN